MFPTNLYKPLTLFSASMVKSGSPFSTESPGATDTVAMRPFIGAVTSPPLASTSRTRMPGSISRKRRTMNGSNCPGGIAPSSTFFALRQNGSFSSLKKPFELRTAS